MTTTTTAKTHLRLRDIMTHEPVCVEPSMRIRELARIFEENEISGAPVVDADGRVIGVVSKTDLIRRCTEGTGDVPPAYLFELLSDEAGEESEVMPEPLVVVEDFMTPDPITATPTELVADVARRMAEHRIHRIIVVDNEGIPVGIVTSLDILKVFPA
jgi:CBS domain-containing protein